jgi:DNA-binding response OmpR family regulator
VDPSRTFTVNFCATLASALLALRKRQFEVVVCERDLPPGSWKDVLEQVTILPDPPSFIVTSRLADEHLWAEALNLGAYDVLTKPFDSTEAMRVVGAAWRAWGGPVRLPARKSAHPPQPHPGAVDRAVRCPAREEPEAHRRTSTLRRPTCFRS